MFVFSTTEAILAFSFAMSRASGAAANASGASSNTWFNVFVSSVAFSRTCALPPTAPALAILAAMLLMTAAEALSPEDAVTTEITLAIFAAAFAIPADPVATKSLFNRSAVEERPRPLATCCAATSADIWTPVAFCCATTASTNVVMGVITSAPSGAFNSPVNFLPVATSIPPLTEVDPKPPCASIKAKSS